MPLLGLTKAAPEGFLESITTGRGRGDWNAVGIPAEFLPTGQKAHAVEVQLGKYDPEKHPIRGVCTDLGPERDWVWVENVRWPQKTSPTTSKQP